MAKSSHAQNVRKVKVSYCINTVRHFYLSESEQFAYEKLGTK